MMKTSTLGGWKVSAAILSVAASLILACGPQQHHSLEQVESSPVEVPLFSRDEGQESIPLTDSGVKNLLALGRAAWALAYFYPTEDALRFDWCGKIASLARNVETANSIGDLAALLQSGLGGQAPLARFGGPGHIAAALPNKTGTCKSRRVWKGFSPREGMAPYGQYWFTRCEGGKPSSELLQEHPAFVEPGATEAAIHLMEGLQLWFPLELPADQASLSFGDRVAGLDDRSLRMAAGLQLLATIETFHPQFSRFSAEWESRSGSFLRELAVASSTKEYVDAIARQLSIMRDGHAGVAHATTRSDFRLPLELAESEGRFFVVGASDERIEIGSELLEIGGVDVRVQASSIRPLIGGSQQWIGAQLAERVSRQASDSVVPIALRDARGHEVTIVVRPQRREEYDSQRSIRGLPNREIESDVWYLDLTRLPAGSLRDVPKDWTASRTLLLDLRGYPAAIRVADLGELAELQRHSDTWKHSWIWFPQGRFKDHFTSRWLVRPSAAPYRGRLVALIDGSTISYGESLAGFLRLANATLIGENTAGANGNVTGMRLPGGVQVRWTGMSVLAGGDGADFYSLGIAPDVVTRVTPQGLRSGRDEQLAAAVDLATSSEQPIGAGAAP